MGIVVEEKKERKSKQEIYYFFLNGFSTQRTYYPYLPTLHVRAAAAAAACIRIQSIQFVDAC